MGEQYYYDRVTGALKTLSGTSGTDVGTTDISLDIKTNTETYAQLKTPLLITSDSGLKATLDLAQEGEVITFDLEPAS